MARSFGLTKDLLPFLEKTLRIGFTLFPVTLLIGICPGLSLWLAFHPQLIASLSRNKIELDLRWEGFGWVLCSVALTFAAYYAGYRFLSAKRATSFEAVTATFNRYASLLFVFPILLFLPAKGITSEHPFFTLTSCAAVGAIVTLFAYRIQAISLFESRSSPGVRMRLGKWTAWSLVLVFSGAYAFILAVLQLSSHRHLGTGAFDLGIYLNTIWQTFHGNILKCTVLPEGTHISAHFDPILIIISPLMAIAPRAETLMIFQSIWLSLGSIPLYLIVVHQLKKPWIGIVFTLVYFFQPALHGISMFDFHSISLIGPIVFWLIYFLETGRFKAYFFAFLLFLLIREDMALLGCLVSLYALICRRPPRVFLATIAIALVYFAAVKLFIMGGGKSYSHYFSDLEIEGQSLGMSILLNLLTNPMYVLARALIELKIVYFLELLVPLLALPFFAGKMRLLFLYGLFFTLLATRDAVYSIAFHYSIYLLPFFLASLPLAMTRLVEGRIAGLLQVKPKAAIAALTIGILASSIAVSKQYGVFWPNETFHAGFYRFKHETTQLMKDRFETVQKVIAMIPEEASVSASERLSPHFATRVKSYLFRKNWHADYVVVWLADEKRKDRFPVWEEFNRSGLYQLILEENDIFFFKRKSLDLAR